MRLFALLLLPGCLFVGPKELDAQIDVDGDGSIASSFGGDDCDDANADVHPGAIDPFYDGIDSDCDGRDDFDADGDGLAAAEFGGADCDDSLASVGDQPVDWLPDCDGDDVPSDAVITSCGEPTGAQASGLCSGDLPPVRWFVARSGILVDCDDANADAHPGAIDPPYDGVDSNCDGLDDFDQDGDGFRVDADCDDTRPDVFPGAPEVWYDGTDSDCAGDDDFDQDADGARLGDDCDDTDPSRAPGLTDIPYDGVDSDCAGDDDFDQDGDGFGLNAALPDCDDTDPLVFPGALEQWYDGTDQDCDGANDFDADGDGWVRTEEAQHVGGTAPFSGDCDDQRADISPLATEVFYDGVDQDCDGGDDFDQDGDGAAAGDDCDDLDPTRHPAATEIWYDGVDSDCLGDDDFDQDADGVPLPLDCDDNDASRHPGASDTPYDGVDTNCDGANDFDQDQDGYVAIAWSEQAGGTAPDVGDCDDQAVFVHPSAPDPPYDGLDSDCAGNNDYDADHDGFVRTGAEAFAQGTAPDVGDCDDNLSSTHPTATDIWYDGIDSNCDGADDFDQDADGSPLSEDCDDEDPARSPGHAEQWYDGIDADCDGADDFDQDQDGSPVGEDCDDLDSNRSPSIIEAFYDGIDADCDGANDFDQDADGFVDAAHIGREGGTAPFGGDCDDLSDERFPGQSDPPYDGIDSDCDGANDYDADADGVVALGFGVFAGGTAAGLGDCNDSDPTINPGEVDFWYDGIDNNCDGANDFDRDGDGAVRAGDDTMAGGTAPDFGDCDDGTPTVRPGLVDQPYDGLDEDCDGTNDFDRDNDGYVSLSFPGTSGGTAPFEGDCDDLNGAVNPGAADLSGIDRNCDGVAILDEDGDGVAAIDDCDDSDPTVWVGDRTLSPGDPVAALVSVACAGVEITVAGEHLLNAPIVVSRPLTLLGTGRLLATGDRVLTVQADLSLQGLTVQDGSATQGGCIQVLAPAQLTVDDVDFEDCVADDGGALWIEPGAGATVSGSLFQGNNADRGGAVFAEQVDIEIRDSTFLSNSARQGGALHLTSGAPVLTNLLSTGDSATEDGGFAWLQSTDLDLQNLFANSSHADLGAAALHLSNVVGRLEGVDIFGATSSSGPSDPGSVVLVTGGIPEETLEIDRWVLRGSLSTAGIRLLDLQGSIDMHDIEIGFHQGIYSLVGNSTGSPSDLTIENLWAHHQISSGNAYVVSLYPRLTLGTYWRLRNATITDNGPTTDSLFVACHQCDGFDVVNVLTGTDSLSTPRSGLTWVDSFGDQLHVRDTTTLHNTPWVEAFTGGPVGFPPDCVDCGTLPDHPFLAPPPSFDVQLHPSSPLKGSGNAALCTGSTAPDCLDPGFWGGPRPPANR